LKQIPGVFAPKWPQIPSNIGAFVVGLQQIETCDVRSYPFEAANRPTVAKMAVMVPRCDSAYSVDKLSLQFCMQCIALVDGLIELLRKRCRVGVISPEFAKSSKHNSLTASLTPKNEKSRPKAAWCSTWSSASS
jgi:hypothetical protein